MHIAITGVSGFLGSRIAARLKSDGHSISGLLRPTSRRDHLEAIADRLIIGDQADDSVWPDLLDGAHCVIHNSFDWSPIRSGDVDLHLRSNLVGSIRLLLASAPRQFIHISSVAVHHDIRPHWNGLIDEDHPTLPASLYGACKAAVEAHLWAEHFGSDRSTCALRPCAVYGIDPKLERSIGFPIIQSISSDRRYDRAGGGKFVHVEDVAAAVAAVVGNPESAGKAYNLADCYARWSDLAAMAADMLGIEAEIDCASPPSPRNRFSKDGAHSLGVALDRGHGGIRSHLAQLIDAMIESGDLAQPARFSR